MKFGELTSIRVRLLKDQKNEDGDLLSVGRPRLDSFRIGLFHLVDFPAMNLDAFGVISWEGSTDMDPLVDFKSIPNPNLLCLPAGEEEWAFDFLRNCGNLRAKGYVDELWRFFHSARKLSFCVNSKGFWH